MIKAKTNKSIIDLTNKSLSIAKAKVLDPKLGLIYEHVLCAKHENSNKTDIIRLNNITCILASNDKDGEKEFYFTNGYEIGSKDWVDNRTKLIAKALSYHEGMYKDEIDDDEVIEKPVTPVVHEEIVNDEVVESVIIDEPEVEVDESGEYTSRFNYSFEAKLIMSDYEVKEQYRKIITFAKAYGVKVSRSWKRERIHLGRKLFANVVFKGKKLCVALPLDPKEYEGTKYRFVDVSEVKRFENTPMLMKLTSERKVKYVCELLEKLFKEANIENKNLPVDFKKIPYKSKNVLLKNGLIKTNLQNQK